MIKLLIFDLDGTLIHSAPDIASALNSILFDRNLQPLHYDVIKAAIGEGFKILLANLYPDHKDDPAFVDSLYTEFLNYYDRHLLDTTKPFEGVENFLQHTHLKTAIVTNKPWIYTEKTLKGLKLDRYPWLRIFGADSLPKRKPDPLPLFEVMKAAGVTPEETLMIGDGIPDMLAAREAGVRAIACEYGYTDIATLKNLGATATLKYFSDLPELIEELNG